MFCRVAGNTRAPQSEWLTVVFTSRVDGTVQDTRWEIESLDLLGFFFLFLPLLHHTFNYGDGAEVNVFPPAGSLARAHTLLARVM